MNPPGQDCPADAGQPAALLNPANLLTMSRLALVPVFLLALLVADGTDPLWRATAALVFAVASLTDRLDGDLARRRGQVTDFGKIADPIADKALIGAALVGLSVLGELPWWVTVLITVREVGVTGLRFWVLRHGVIPASRGGKVKTFAQTVAIGLYVLPLPPAAEPVCWVVMGIALVLTVVTGIDYLVQALRLRVTARRAVVTP
ncbi:MAG TPA: CDP-diacylglycerol--glycerol-3-phosphate 3-phosphatidyltransferase [Pseudonocardiaceae bacterium]|nr:CDP-diacylglycerol--glycerol-3-phosphate 3-phosphatidyltransferase [Pseudonocardiaceae bacterium]